VFSVFANCRTFFCYYDEHDVDYPRHENEDEEEEGRDRIRSTR